MPHDHLSKNLSRYATPNLTVRSVRKLAARADGTLNRTEHVPENMNASAKITSARTVYPLADHVIQTVRQDLEKSQPANEKPSGKTDRQTASRRALLEKSNQKYDPTFKQSVTRAFREATGLVHLAKPAPAHR